MAALLDLLTNLEEETRQTIAEMALLRIDLETLRAEVHGRLRLHDWPEERQRIALRLEWIEESLRTTRAAVNTHLEKHHHAEQAEKDAQVSFGFWTDLMDAIRNRLFARRK